MDSFTKKHLQSLKKGAATAAAAGFFSAPFSVSISHASESQTAKKLKAGTPAESDSGVSISTLFKAAASFIFKDKKETAYFTCDSWLYSRPYIDDSTKTSVSQYSSITVTGTNSGDFWRAETENGETVYIKKSDVTTDETVIESMKQKDDEAKEQQEKDAEEAKKDAEAFTKAQEKAKKEAEEKAKEEKKKQEEKKKKEEEEKKKAKEEAEKAASSEAEKLAMEKLEAQAKKLEAEAEAEASKKAEKLELSQAQAKAKQAQTEASQAQAEAEQEKINTILSQSVSDSDTGTKAVEIAKTKLGHNYVFGAEGPDVFDCSGFTMWVYRQLGVSLPRSAASQYGAVTHTDTPSVGDLVFFKNTYKEGISHVGIVIGNGMMIHAASRKSGLIISSYKSNYYSAHFAGFGKMS